MWKITSAKDPQMVGHKPQVVGFGVDHQETHPTRNRNVIHLFLPPSPYLSFVSLGLWNVIGLMKCPHQMMENVTNVSIIFDFSLVKPFLIHPENQHSWLEKGPCMKIHFLHNIGIFRPAMLVSGRNYISPSRQWTTPWKNPGAQKSWRFGKFRWCSFSSIGDFEVKKSFIVIF